MPYWLVEGNPSLYFLLACAEVILLALWWRTRKRKYAIEAGVVALLIVGVFVLDRAVESDREQMVRKTFEVTEAVTAGHIDRAFERVSDSFQYGSVNKDSFRQFATSIRQSGRVTSVTVWDVTPVEVSREARRGMVEFPFKVRGSFGETPPNYFARVTFTLDADGQWRVKTFDIFNALTESKSPVVVPGMGR